MDGDDAVTETTEQGGNVFTGDSGPEDVELIDLPLAEGVVVREIETAIGAQPVHELRRL